MSTYLEAHTVQQSKRQYGSAFELSETELAAIEGLGEQGDVYGRLARSIAPEIFGMEDVKKVRPSSYVCCFGLCVYVCVCVCACMCVCLGCVRGVLWSDVRGRW